MQNSTYVALSSQMALQRQMDVIANNLANQSTPAFKDEEMLFSQYLMSVRGSGPLAFVQDSGTARDLRQGPLTSTGNPLDLALSGSGYFAVQTPLGTRYTRNGHFALNPQGEVVTSDGFPLLTKGDQPLTLPGNTRSISVAQDGTVSTSTDGTTATGQAGQLELVDFAAPQEVTPGANGLWVTDQTPQPANATLQQGAIEESNVQPVVELTRMLAVARASGNITNFLNSESQRRNNAVTQLGKFS